MMRLSVLCGNMVLFKDYEYVRKKKEKMQDYLVLDYIW